MKIFPLRLMSNYDIMVNLKNILQSNRATKSLSKPDTVIIDNKVKTLKKGRSICEKLSE